MIARRSLVGKALATCSTTFLRHCLQLVPAAMAPAPLDEAALAAAVATAVRLADEDEAAEAVALAGAANAARRYMVLRPYPTTCVGGVCVGGVAWGWVGQGRKHANQIER